MSVQQSPKARRTFIDQVSYAWHTASEPVWIGAGAVGAFQILMMIRLAGSDIVHSQLWSVLLAVLACTVLLVRRRWPLAVTGVTALTVLVASLEQTSSYYAVPLLVAVYALTARASAVCCLAGIGLAAGCLSGAGVIESGTGGMGPRVLPPLLVLTVMVAAATAFRYRRDTVAHLDTQLAGLARQRHLADQRDAARSQARIAAELHDSVGHDLTAIIALSEGLRDTTGDPGLEEAIDTINTLARDGLADTRSAVRALQPETSGDPDAAVGNPDAGPSLHTWDDLEPLLATTRSTGLAVARTRTGIPPEDQLVAEACYVIVREALTNIMRHATGATRVTVALDHDHAATTITVKDNGLSAPTDQQTKATPTGLGLARLTELAASHDGTLTVGPTTDGWRLHATLSHTETP